MRVLTLMTLFFTTTAMASMAKFSTSRVERGSLYRGNALTIFVCQKQTKVNRSKSFTDCGMKRHEFVKNTNLKSKTMRGLRADETRFWEVDFSNANMELAHLRDSFFVKSKMSNVNLSGANLTKSVLAEVDLGNANLCGASLVGSDLSKTTNLDSANLKGALYSDETKLPFDKKQARKKGMIRVKSELQGTEKFTYAHVRKFCSEEADRAVAQEHNFIDETNLFRKVRTRR